jgi:hypothetical protein
VRFFVGGFYLILEPGVQKAYAVGVAMKMPMIGDGTTSKTRTTVATASRKAKIDDQGRQQEACPQLQTPYPYY